MDNNLEQIEIEIVSAFSGIPEEKLKHLLEVTIVKRHNDNKVVEEDVLDKKHIGYIKGYDCKVYLGVTEKDLGEKKPFYCITFNDFLRLALVLFFSIVLTNLGIMIINSGDIIIMGIVLVVVGPVIGVYGCYVAFFRKDKDTDNGGLFS